MSERRAVSITPTILSVSLDQVEAIHSTSPSVREKMKSLSVSDNKLTDRNSMSPTHYQPVEVCHCHCRAAYHLW